MRNRSRPCLEQLEDRNLMSADLAALLTNGPVSNYSVDGSGNNAAHPDWGAAGTQLLRIGAAEYGDGISAPAGADRPSAREVSNTVAAQANSILNNRNLTDFIWIWGQFIDHDLDLTVGANPAEPLPIQVPTGDPFFDPASTGTATIPFSRSNYDPLTGTGVDNPRQQINSITSWMDGSMVYGSDSATAAALRTFSGGKLKTSAGDLLPLAGNFFMAGDIRVNENAALIAIQTLWLREHNQWADRIAAQNPNLTDEQIYQRARALVIAEIQVITYNEFLPALLGEGALAPYTGYHSDVNPGVSNFFSTAAFRVGHTMLSPTLLRLNNDGSVSADGNLPLRDAFFNPGEVIDNGIDSLLRGAAAQKAQEIDNQIVDDVRNFLFGPPGAGGFDLASLNIQRGRDHGLQDYNQARVDFGLAPVTSFAQITSNADLQARLEALYGNVNNIDPWVGALAEDHMPGASVGQLIQRVLADQFTRLRDGDPNWYQRVYHGEALAQLEKTTLADVMRRNTDVENIQDNVFYDSSVLYFKIDARSGPISVVVDGDSVDIVEGRNRVLESKPLADVAQVIVVGSDRRGDQITVNLSRAQQTVPGGILIYGGAGPGDTLVIRSTPRADQVEVQAHSLSVNGQRIEYRAIEHLVVETNARADRVRLVALPSARLQVTGPGVVSSTILLQPPEGPAPRRDPLSAAAVSAMSPLARQLFLQLREDLIRRAREVLSDDLFQAFVAGLLGPNANPLSNGVQGAPPNGNVSPRGGR